MSLEIVKDFADVKYYFEDTVVVGTLYCRTGLQLLELRHSILCTSTMYQKTKLGIRHFYIKIAPIPSQIRLIEQYQMLFLSNKAKDSKLLEHNILFYYHLYQAIWRSNKSVYLISSGKSTRM